MHDTSACCPLHRKNRSCRDGRNTNTTYHHCLPIVEHNNNRNRLPREGCDGGSVLIIAAPTRMLYGYWTEIYDKTFLEPPYSSRNAFVFFFHFSSPSPSLFYLFPAILPSTTAKGNRKELTGTAAAPRNLELLPKERHEIRLKYKLLILNRFYNTFHE